MHIGKNIGKIRELLGVKQESLAFTLKISQQTISKIEQTPDLRGNTVDRIAAALGISPEMILKYDDELLIDFLKMTASKPKKTNGHPPTYLMLSEKIIELYERLLSAEKEKTTMLNLKNDASR